MSQLLKEAHVAYKTKDYHFAKGLYNFCVSSSPLIAASSDEKNQAYYMLACLHFKNNCPEDALRNFQLLGDANYRSKKLPGRYTKLSAIDLVLSFMPTCDAYFKSLSSLNLAKCQIKGKSVKKLIQIIDKLPSLTSLDLHDNPMTASDVHSMLDVISSKSLAHLNLSSLPIDIVAAHQIARLIQLADERKSSLQINLDSHQLATMHPILRALKMASNASVIVEIKNEKSHVQLVSDKLIQNSHAEAKSLFEKNNQDINNTSQQILRALISDGVIRVNAPNAICRLLLEGMPNQIIYDNEGNICAHISCCDGHVIVNILKSIDFQISRLSDFMPCESLSIHGPNANILVDDNSLVMHHTKIYCNSLVIPAQTKIISPFFQVHAKNKCLLQGQIETEVLKVDTCNFVLEDRAQILPLSSADNHLSPLPPLPSVSVTADLAEFGNTKLTLSELEINTKDSLVLPASLSIHAQKLLVSSSSNISLQGVINTDELSLHADKLVQVCSDATISSQTTSLNGHDIACAGKIRSNHLTCLADDALIMDSRSALTTTQLELSAKDIECLGEIEVRRFIAYGQKQKIAGKINSHDKGGDKDGVSYLSIESNGCEIDGVIHVDAFSIKSDQLFFTSRSALTSRNILQSIQPIQSTGAKTQSPTSYIECDKKFYLDEGAVIQRTEKLLIKTSDMTSYGTIHSSNDISMEINGCGKLHDQSNIKGRNIHLEGDRLWHSGEMAASENLHLAFDKFIFNGICDFNPIAKFKNGKSLGRLSGKNVKITSAFFLSLLATLEAGESLQTNALMNINVGLVNAKNVTHNGLIGIDLGINLTVVKSIQGIVELIRSIVQSTDSKDAKARLKEHFEGMDPKAVAMSSVSYFLQLANITAKLLTIFAPSIGLPASILVNCVSLATQLIRHSKTIHDEIKKLHTKRMSDQPIHPRDVYELVLGIGGMAMTSLNTVNVGMSLPGAFVHVPMEAKSIGEGFASLAASVAGIFAGSVTTQSVIQVNMLGGTLTGLSTSTALLHFSLLHPTIAGTSFHNNLIDHQQFCFHLAAMQSIATKHYSEHQGFQLAHEGSLVTQSAHLSGQSKFDQFTLMTEQLAQEGNLTVHQGVINAKAAMVGGKLSLAQGGLTAEQFQTASGAEVDLSHVNANVEHLSVAPSSTVQIDHSEIKSSTIAQSGTLILKDSHVASKSIELQSQSETALKNTALATKTFNQAEKAALHTNSAEISADQTHFAGQTKVSHGFVVVAKEEIDLSQTGQIKSSDSGETKNSGSYIVLSAPHIEKKGTIDADSVSLSSHYSSDEVNALVTDPTLKAHALRISTDQDVTLNHTVTCTEELNLIARSITEISPQLFLHALNLQATEGDILLNTPLDHLAQLFCDAGGKIVVHHSIDTTLLGLHAAKGIFCQRDPHMPHIHDIPREGSSQLVTKLIQQTHSGSEKSLSENTRQSDKEITLHADHIEMKSDQDINILGTHVQAKILLMEAKGKIIFDINGAHKTTIKAQTGFLHANTIMNNGQRLAGESLYFSVDETLTNQHQGTITAEHFLSIEANDLQNLCQARTVQTEYGAHQEYAPSRIQGGDGKETNGVGAQIVLKGQLKNDASIIQSKGGNVILAKKDIRFSERHSTFTSGKHDESHFLGLNQTHEEVKETLVAGSHVISTEGQNVIISQEGKVVSTATEFSAQSGTLIGSHKDAEFYDLVASTHTRKDSRTLGLFHKAEEQHEEYAIPTRIDDLKGITLMSDQDVVARGLVVNTPKGQFEVDAVNFYFSVSKLKNSYHYTGFGMNASLCNQAFLSSYTPRPVNQPLLYGDPTYTSFRQLGNSQGLTETMLNAWSAGINVANTTNALLNGLRTNTLLLEAFKRYAPSIYAPQLTFSLTKTILDQHIEALGEGGIYAGSVKFNVREKVSIKGAPIQVQGDMAVKAKLFILEGETLHSDMNQQIDSLNFTISALGDPYQLGVSHSDHHLTSDTNVNQVLSVGGTLILDVQVLTQNGSVIETQRIAGKVGQWTMISRTDHFENQTKGFSLSTGGNVSFCHQETISQLVNQPTTLHVREDINKKPGELVVHYLVTQGGVITSDGKNHFKADRATATPVMEFQTTSGFSAAGNIKSYFTPDMQVNHLLRQDKQTRQITTGVVSIMQNQHRGENKAVIYGSEGTDIQIKHTNGEIKTTSPDGKVVHESSSHQYEIVIPWMDQPTREQFARNITWAAEKLKPTSPARSTFFNSPHQSVNADLSREKTVYHHGKSVSRQSYLRDEEQTSKKLNTQDTDTSQITDEISYGALKENGEVVSQEELKESYLQGKMAAATGDIPDLGNYSESERAKFYIGYYEVKGTQSGMLLTPHLTLGTIALPVAAELAGNMLALGVRTYNAVAPIMAETKHLWSLGIRTLGLFKQPAMRQANSDANNNINLLRLNEQLSTERREALFNEFGELSLQAIDESEVIMGGDELKNNDLITILTELGGELEDWGKYTTGPISTLSGEFEIHFYRNPVINEIYYGMDYKAKPYGRSTLFPTQAILPKFDFELVNFNK